MIKVLADVALVLTPDLLTASTISLAVAVQVDGTVQANDETLELRAGSRGSRPVTILVGNEPPPAVDNSRSKPAINGWSAADTDQLTFTVWPNLNSCPPLGLINDTETPWSAILKSPPLVLEANRPPVSVTVTLIRACVEFNPAGTVQG